jgi:hypothetical protein
MHNFGAIIGPLFAIALVPVRTAILSIIGGLIARPARPARTTAGRRVRSSSPATSPATLLNVRATDLLEHRRGQESAASGRSRSILRRPSTLASTGGASRPRSAEAPPKAPDGATTPRERD